MTSLNATSGEAARVSRTLTITNQRGLHARAAAKFADTAGKYTSEISVCRADVDDGPRVNGSSILGLMMLAAEPGATIRVDVAGEDALKAADALDKLVCDKFGEGE